MTQTSDDCCPRHAIDVPRKPLIFSDFFALGQQESESPFLTPTSARWGKNLSLRSSLIAAFLLVLSFFLARSAETAPLASLSLISVYFLVGIPSLIDAIEDILSLEINIDVLMTLAAFSSVFIGSGFEGGLLLVLFALAGAIEKAVKTKAKSALSSLHKLSPTRATVVTSDGTLKEIAVEDIAINTHILVKANEIVPLDGEVIEGSSSVNLVHLTGESLPVTKTVGDELAAGARNLDGALTVKVTRTNNDSTLSKIVELVTQAQESKPRLQRWFGRLSRRYATTIILLSLLFTLTFPILLSIPLLGEEGSLYRALSFLIAASPCALILAMPIAYLSAISACARKGVLLKGGATLDALAGCTAFAFDKTGTLTTGKLHYKKIEPILPSPTISTETALALAYALEKNAVHPIAAAILEYCEEKSLPKIKLENFRSIPGYGLEATTTIQGKTHSLSLGHTEWMQTDLKPEIKTLLRTAIEEGKKAGEILAVLTVDQEPFLFCFEDSMRPNALNMTKSLKEKYNFKLFMLSGDHEQNAKKIAQKLSIDNYLADLKPEDKLREITALSQKEKTAMIGDGINDAPALAHAHVGICMGKVGSGAAIDAADIILLNDNIEYIDWLVAKARKTKAIVRQNLFIAASAIVVASIPALLGVVPLWLAVTLHEGGTVLVGLNALRLIGKK